MKIVIINFLIIKFEKNTKIKGYVIDLKITGGLLTQAINITDF